MTSPNQHNDSDDPIQPMFIPGFIWHIQSPNKIHKRFSRVNGIGSVVVQSDREEDAEKQRAADPWHQPDHPLQVAPEQDSNLNISVALNDDCLYEIFKRFELRDLTNVAAVCKRFNEQAKKTFALKHKHKHLDLAELLDYQSNLFETAMETFGKHIKSLSIDANLFSNEANAYRMIDQYCGPKLKQLQLRNFRFQIDPRSLRPIFAEIEQLKLDRCNSSIGLGELLTWCGELKSLSLSSCVLEDNQYIFSRTFPKLQELSLSCDEFDDEHFEGFVTRHPTLIKLSFEYIRFTPRLLLHTIGQKAENLQELELICVRDLRYQYQNDTIGLRKMLMHANKLKLLKLLWIGSIKIDVDDYRAMLCTVQMREETVSLVIKICGKESQVEVPAPVLTQSKSTFNIKLIR